MREEKISIPCGSIQLEGLFSIQEALTVKGGVIFCHPHPLYGGDMDNAVVATAVEAASQEGFSTLRFNFRGVGESEGSYGEGIAEREDVKAVIDFFVSRVEDPHVSMVLLGYSFGAWAGMPVAVEDGRIKGLVAVAPPLGLYDFGFFRGCRKRKLFIAGSRDDYCPSPQLEELFREVEEPKSLRIVQGADHFFSFHHSALVKPVREFLRSMAEV